MIVRKFFNQELAEKENSRKKGFYFFICSIFVIGGSSLLNKSEIASLWLMLIFFLGFSGVFLGFLIMVNSVQSLKKIIVCPGCKKSLSYLVTDPNYTNKYFSFELPKEFPEDVTHCPFCKHDLNSEENDD